MTTGTPTESDPFFQLLTDALRAGPGSAQWEQAVTKLRDGGAEGGDEYKLIIRAREDLEQGRDFRKVSAGPGFTRKVLDAVEREGSRRSGIPTATIVAILSGLVILGVVVTVIVIMSRGGSTPSPSQAAVERLEAASLPVSVASASVNGAAPASPAGFRVFEATPFYRTGTTQLASFTVAGVMTRDGLDPATAGAIEVDLVLPAAGPSQPPLEVFVSDAAEIRPGTTPYAGPPNEILWHYQDGRATVFAAGQQQPDSAPFGAPGETVKVVIRFDRESAVVTAGGRRMYAGPHGLGAERGRHAGVRLFQAPGDKVQWAPLRSVSIAQAASAGGG